MVPSLSLQYSQNPEGGMAFFTVEFESPHEDPLVPAYILKEWHLTHQGGSPRCCIAKVLPNLARARVQHLAVSAGGMHDTDISM